MYIRIPDGKKLEDLRVTPAAVKAELEKRARNPWRKLSRRAVDIAALPYNEDTAKGHEYKAEGPNPGELDRLAEELAAVNNAIVREALANGGYARNAARCICEKEPRGGFDKGRHYYNVYYVTEEGSIERLGVCGKAARAVMGLGKRDGVDTGFFSSGAIGMSRQMDATDVIFCVLREAGGVYAQF